jgi:mannose-1-phosphate guanylyltransferase
MAEVNQQLSRDARQSRRWGVLLAGGDGIRLKNLTRLISGDDRPKQFCRLFGDDSLLGRARKRAERSISPEQILVPLTWSHRAFYVQEPEIRPSQRIVQPANRGTAPAILYSLLSIERIDDDGLVAILPSDHYFSNERAFTGALESAFEIAAQYPRAVVLLGASPQGPEVEYGWIEIGPSVHGACGAWSRVRGFFEKPSFHAVRELLARGALWNTFVMVGHVRGFLEMVNASLADVLGHLRGSQLWSGAEVHVQDSLYDRGPAIDFSREVLSVQTPRLLALRMADTGWSDLGHPERVMAVLQAARLEPWWMKKWKAPERDLANKRRSTVIIQRVKGGTVHSL